MNQIIQNKKPNKQKIRFDKYVSTSPTENTLQKPTLHKLKKAVASLQVRNSIKGLLSITTNYAVYICCIACSLIALNNTSRSLAYIVYGVCAIIITGRLRCFENLVHEASHFNIFPKKILNEKLNFLYGFPVFKDVAEYRHWHNIHHTSLNKSNDPDYKRMLRLGVSQFPKNYYTVLFFKPLLGFMTYEYLRYDFIYFWKVNNILLSKIIFWICILAVIIFCHWWVYFLLYYIIPFFFILPITRFWAEASEHSGLQFREEYCASRNNLGKIFQRYIVYPLNDGYHAVHHICWGIPWYNLPEANKILNQFREYRDYVVSLKRTYSTFKDLNNNKTKK